jgi:hypothetical protein
MLKVTLHIGTPNTVSQANIIGSLDIGYAKLEAHADYKALMFTAGIGEHKPIEINKYPRWSGSVWDLVTRAICLSLHGKEALIPVDTIDGRCAFIDDMTALIEHWPDGVNVNKSTIATAHITMRKRRGNYTATFSTDIEGDVLNSSIFTYKAKILNPWDLLSMAYAWSVSESFEMPPRPRLYVPIAINDSGKSLVNLNTVSEPAYSGFIKWMHKRDIKTTISEFVSGPCVTEDQFVKFLRTAV